METVISFFFLNFNLLYKGGSNFFLFTKIFFEIVKKKMGKPQIFKVSKNCQSAVAEKSNYEPKQNLKPTFSFHVFLSLSRFYFSYLSLAVFCLSEFIYRLIYQLVFFLFWFVYSLVFLYQHQLSKRSVLLCTVYASDISTHLSSSRTTTTN